MTTGVSGSGGKAITVVGGVLTLAGLVLLATGLTAYFGNQGDPDAQQAAIFWLLLAVPLLVAGPATLLVRRRAAVAPHGRHRQA